MRAGSTRRPSARGRRRAPRPPGSRLRPAAGSRRRQARRSNPRGRCSATWMIRARRRPPRAAAAHTGRSPARHRRARHTPCPRAAPTRQPSIRPGRRGLRWRADTRACLPPPGRLAPGADRGPARGTGIRPRTCRPPVGAGGRRTREPTRWAPWGGDPAGPRGTASTCARCRRCRDRCARALRPRPRRAGRSRRGHGPRRGARP